MTRTFVMYSYGTTDPNFDIDRYETSGLNYVCSCVISALWLSKNVRRDTRFFVILNTGQKPPVTIRFDGNKILGVEPSERSIVSVIKKSLHIVKDKEWASVQSGVSVSRKSFQEIIKESANVIVLDAKGTHITKTKLQNPTFVLGDHVGLPKKDMQFALRKGTKVSLGRNIYLASSVISVVNWVLDEQH